MQSVCGMGINMLTIRKIAKKFSGIEGFNGAMIIKLDGKLKEAHKNWNISKLERQAEIVKSKRNYVLLRLENQQVEFQMYLMRTVQSKEGIKTHLKENQQSQNLSEEKSYIFSRQEILEFVNEAGDYNQIHRTENPVVPGFLLLEKLWNDKITNFEIVFRSPVYAGEEIHIKSSKDGEKKKIVIQKNTANGMVNCAEAKMSFGE